MMLPKLILIGTWLAWTALALALLALIGLPFGWAGWLALTLVIGGGLGAAMIYLYRRYYLPGATTRPPSGGQDSPAIEAGAPGGAPEMLNAPPAASAEPTATPAFRTALEDAAHLPEPPAPSPAFTNSDNLPADELSAAEAPTAAAESAPPEAEPGAAHLVPETRQPAETSGPAAPASSANEAMVAIPKPETPSLLHGNDYTQETAPDAPRPEPVDLPLPAAAAQPDAGSSMDAPVDEAQLPAVQLEEIHPTETGPDEAQPDDPHPLAPQPVRTGDYTQDGGPATQPAPPLQNPGDAEPHTSNPERRPPNLEHAYRRALTAARQAGDRNAEGAALANLGAALAAGAQYDAAFQAILQAVEIARALGDRRAEAARLGNLGLVCNGRGQNDLAVSFQRQSLALAEAQNDPALEAAALARLGLALEAIGEHEQAAGRFRRAAGLFAAIGDARRHADALARLAAAETAAEAGKGV